MFNPHAMRILVWFVLSMVICICVWLFRRKSLKEDYAALAIARERFIEEGANATYPQNPTLPDNPSESLVKAYNSYKYWKDKMRETGSTGLHIMLHIPGVVAIILLFSL